MPKKKEQEDEAQKSNPDRTTTFSQSLLSQELQGTSDGRVACPHCKQLCKNKAGVKIHISLKHKTEQRDAIAKKYIQPPKRDGINESTQEQDVEEDKPTI